MNSLTHFSCFSGVGGLDLAAELAGFQTIGQVEKADYPYAVLCKNWKDVPKWRDIKDVTVRSIGESGIERDKITVLSGGFPCQPVSYCGKRRGEADENFLWGEMFRVINELRPPWYLGENVVGFKTMGLDRAIGELEGIGYSCQTFDIPATSVGAEHKRRRLFIVATNTKSLGMEGLRGERISEPQPLVKTLLPNRTRDGVWKIEPDLRRGNDGLSNWTYRLKCLGNAVIPYQAYPFFKAIATIEGVRI